MHDRVQARFAERIKFNVTAFLIPAGLINIVVRFAVVSESQSFELHFTPCSPSSKSKVRRSFSTP